MAWTGNPSNANIAPNSTQKNDDRSELLVRNSNRAEQIRRDTDKRKNFTVTLLDIDGVVLKHLSETLQLHVVDDGQRIKVPVIYANAEKWHAIRKDGFMRDYSGKVQLPVIAFRRTNMERNNSVATFHQQLKSTVMRTFSPKNKYTRYYILNNQNAPINEVYNVSFPYHMMCNYNVIIWTEYVEQNNKILEDIAFSTRDYWGEKNGYKFRVDAESYETTTELQQQNDRIVRTEFNLKVAAYLLPELAKLAIDKELEETTQKFLTPKKIILGMEVVPT
jgi:hypothetical protein